MHYHKRIFFFMLFVLLPISARSKLPSPCYLLNLTTVGFPAIAKAPEAWPIHDLMFYNERLYVGNGDAVVNTGPTDVICYDVQEDTFITEFTVDDEAIYYYQMIDGQLIIPGVDATEDWTMGNFYVRADSGWTKHRTIPHGIHVNSLASFNNQLFACTGAFSGIGADTIAFGCIFTSTDHGQTWRVSYTTPTDEQSTYRVNAIVPFQEMLFAFSFGYHALKKEEIPEKYHGGLSDRTVDEGYYLLLKPDILGTCDVIVNDGTGWVCKDILPYEKLCYVNRPFVFNDQLILPVLCGEYIDYLNDKREKTAHATRKLVAYTNKKSRDVKLHYDILVDVLVKADTLFLLIASDEQHFIARTADLKKWTYYLIPPSITAPKSLEYSAGTFYIGAGDGMLFESTSIVEIKDIADAQGKMPQRIIGVMTSHDPMTSYWLCLESRQTSDRRAIGEAAVKYGNIIKVKTDNIAALRIRLPWEDLDPDHEIMLIIDGLLVFEGIVKGATYLVCAYDETGPEAGWSVQSE